MTTKNETSVTKTAKVKTPRVPRPIDPAVKKLKDELKLKVKATTIAAKLDTPELECAVMDAIDAKRIARAKPVAVGTEPKVDKIA